MEAHNGDLMRTLGASNEFKALLLNMNKEPKIITHVRKLNMNDTDQDKEGYKNKNK